MIDLVVEEEKVGIYGARIKVLGIGGAGGNAVNSMITGQECSRVDFIVSNTDAQALELSSAATKIQIGQKITKGLGAGSNPEVGRRAAEEDLEPVIQSIEGADILFLTGGLGGGTGSGALPVVAQAARDKGILTVAIVTKPFSFEGKRRSDYAEEAVENLKAAVDTLIVVPNQKLIEIVDPKISMLDAFGMSNDILSQAIHGISDIVQRPGLINVDFADIRSVMKDMGMAIMGTGRRSGEERASQAALDAISSPLLENVNIEGARGVLVNITGNTDLGLHEIHQAAGVIHDLVSEDANIILGSVINPELGEDIMVTVIATGFEPRVETTRIPHIHVAPQIKPTAEPVIERAPEPMPEYQAKSYGEEEKKYEPAPEPEPEPEIEEEPTPEPEILPEEKSEEEPERPDDSTPLKPEKPKIDMDDLDTPTFLRKQAERENPSS
ncbi:cell division protein FtsZ [bacterium]|nr:cell division protein FtsZ [bacterium]